MSEIIQKQTPPYQQRVVDEKTALDEKIEKLSIFTKTATFNSISLIERNSLVNQLNIMQHYSRILQERISRFN